MNTSSSSIRANPSIGCASSEASMAAELIANTDLLIEILVYLPATSLIRFMSVSKHWLSLISSSRFTNRHTVQNPRSSASGLFLRRNGVPGKPAYVSLQGPPNPPSLAFLDGIVGTVRSFPKINHSSNGLLLCEYPWCISPNVFTSRFLVCNPTTRSYKFLPCRLLPRMLLGFLAFDPSKSPHYKVVAVGLYASASVQIDIFFSESSSWKQFNLPNGGVRNVAVCSGVIHWIGGGNVRGFDIDSEKMLEFPSLPTMDGIRYFGEFAGRLTLIQSTTPSSLAFRILEMDKDHWHWIVKFQGTLGPLLSVCPELFGSTTDYWPILYIVEGNKEKDFGLVLAFRGKVIFYNLKSKAWNILSNEPIRYSHPCAACPFVASLSPL